MSYTCPPDHPFYPWLESLSYIFSEYPSQEGDSEALLDAIALEAWERYLEDDTLDCFESTQLLPLSPPESPSWP